MNNLNFTNQSKSEFGLSHLDSNNVNQDLESTSSEVLRLTQKAKPLFIDNSQPKLFRPLIYFRRLLATLAISSSLIGGLPYFVSAQSNPGLTIFSGVERKDILNYHLDFGGNAGGWDRYRLRIPGKKLTQGVARFFISYPEYYDGKFDVDKIEVRINDDSLPLREVVWDKESRIIEIDLEEPIIDSKRVELVFSNVKNPRSGGTYYFQCQILTPGQVPLRLHLGTWIVGIGNN